MIQVNEQGVLEVKALSDTFTENFTTTTYLDGSTTAINWGSGSISNPLKSYSLVGTYNSPSEAYDL